MEKPVKLVTVATFDFITDAEIARGRLTTEGIEAFVADAHLVQTDWLFSPAVGGIKLQVASHRAQEALAVLARDYSGDLE